MFGIYLIIMIELEKLDKDRNKEDWLWIGHCRSQVMMVIKQFYFYVSLKLSIILRSSNLPTFLCLVSDEAGNGTQDCIFSRACALYMTVLFYLFPPDPGWELFFPASFTHALPSVWIPSESGYSTEMFFSWMSCDFDPLILFLARETFPDHCQLKLH